MTGPATLRATLITVLLLATSPPAVARMYQWADPDTGTPQLSGKPPWWYRTGEPGPRVYVIEDGRVVDDTSVSVPEAKRQQLREAAFRRAEQDQARLNAALEEDRRLGAEHARRREEERLAAEAASPAPKAIPDEKPAEAASTEKSTRAEVEVMRALVDEWEKAREESAKMIIHE
jgi:hypothetical protein